MFLNTFNALKKALRRGVSDDEIIEVNPGLYVSKHIIYRYEGIRVYDINSDSKYEIALHLATNSDVVFSLCRSESLDDILCKFTVLQDKLPILMTVIKDFHTVSGVKKVYDVLVKNPTWNLAHISAYMGLIEALKNPEIEKYICECDTSSGKSSLHVAIEAKNLKIVEHLLTLNKLFDHLDFERNNVYHYAAVSNPEIINVLCNRSKSNLNNRNKQGYTPLHVACLNDNPDCVKALLAAGADCNIEASQVENNVTPLQLTDFLKEHANGLSHQDMKNGGSPLHWSSSRPVVYALVARNCNINAVNFIGQTALHVMVIRNRLDCVIALLTHNALINVKDREGNTPIFYAVRSNFTSIIECLLIFGADLSLLNAKNESIRHQFPSHPEKKTLYYLKLFNAARCQNNTQNCTDICSWNGTFDGVDPIKESKIERDSIGKLLTECTIQASRNAANTKGYRVLCLDGGGIRGLVLCGILAEIEKVVGKPIISCFDWVAGTSTGGVLALGLAIGKSLKECICMYFRLKENAFVGNRPYSSENLENIFHEIFGEIKRINEIRKPKVMITAVLVDRRPVDLHIFRNYPSPHSIINVPEEEPMEDPFIWQVARATGAAPTYFRSFRNFVDGGLMSNNPTLDALTEILEFNSALSIENRTSEVLPINLVVSLGSGCVESAKCSEVIDCEGFDNIIRSAIKYQNMISLFKLLIDQTTQTGGRVVDRARAWCHSLRVPYFRFNPVLSEDIVLNEKSDDKLIKLLIETKVYMYENMGDVKCLAELLLKYDPSSQQTRQPCYNAT